MILWIAFAKVLYKKVDSQVSQNEVFEMDVNELEGFGSGIRTQELTTFVAFCRSMYFICL